MGRRDDFTDLGMVFDEEPDRIHPGTQEGAGGADPFRGPMIPNDPKALPLIGREADEWLRLRAEGIDPASIEGRMRLAMARIEAEEEAEDAEDRPEAE